ncbi:Rwp-rk domain protein [Thalictrum thalictroides]|uniref:Rwp-rk domain protein n=1 Tax=Thalictrum thalictroides TaxID=46969 RepID=A0A7J6UTD9_THATH|nr:Rwp-rk domain protein [Thalictrum thalictroides]
MEDFTSFHHYGDPPNSPLAEDLSLFFDSDNQNQSLDEIVGPSIPIDDHHGFAHDFDTFTMEEFEHDENNNAGHSDPIDDHVFVNNFDGCTIEELEHSGENNNADHSNLIDDAEFENILGSFSIQGVDECCDGIFGTSNPLDDPICTNNFETPLIQGENETGGEIVGLSDDNNLLERGFTIEEEHQPCNEIVAHSVPVNVPVICGTSNTSQEKNCERSRDSVDSFDDPIDDQDEQEARAEHVNSENTNAMPLAVWPPRAVPYNCSCCQVLRDIVHSNGTFTTKLEIHGRVGIICHAILEVRYDASVQHQMIDFCMRSMEAVKQYLMSYCQDRKEAGFVMLQDPLATFYGALCVGLNWDDNVNTFELIQPFQTETGFDQKGHPVAESSSIRLPQSSLAAQRVRTGKLKISDLVHYFHLPIDVAAKRLAICPTAIKKICRKYGLKRWPHRKLKSIERKISELESNSTNKNGHESRRARAKIERLKNDRDKILSGRVCEIS